MCRAWIAWAAVRAVRSSCGLQRYLTELFAVHREYAIESLVHSRPLLIADDRFCGVADAVFAVFCAAGAVSM